MRRMKVRFWVAAAQPALLACALVTDGAREASGERANRRYYLTANERPYSPRTNVPIGRIVHTRTVLRPPQQLGRRRGEFRHQRVDIDAKPLCYGSARFYRFLVNGSHIGPLPSVRRRAANGAKYGTVQFVPRIS